MSNASEGAGHDRVQGPEAKVAAAPVVYLDHAATTPMVPEALDAMTEELAQLGNPSSLHNAGRRARRVVEESREQIAEAYGARPSEVVFTSGGTEADNLAVKGLFWARRAADPRQRRVLIPAIEHHAVLDCAGWLHDHQGADLGWLAPDGAGRIGPEALREAIERDAGSVALVSVMWANNEVGTVQPVAGLAAVAREYRIPLHSDAVQAAGQLPVSLAESGAAALTVTGHKIGGPVGAGALLLARGTDLVPVLHGGGQERDVRSGTLDAPAIRAFAVAVEIATERRGDEAKRRAGQAAGQRPLLVPRLRGRRSADAARRQGHRLLDRFRLHGRRGAAQPRAARAGGR